IAAEFAGRHVTGEATYLGEITRFVRRDTGLGGLEHGDTLTAVGRQRSHRRRHHGLANAGPGSGYHQHGHGSDTNTAATPCLHPAFTSTAATTARTTAETTSGTPSPSYRITRSGDSGRGHHRVGDEVDVRIGGDVRRHRVDQVAERPQPHASGGQRLGGHRHVHRVIELHHADGSEHPHVHHPRYVPRGRESVPEPTFDTADLLPPGAVGEQSERGVRDRRGERIAHERRPVRQYRYLTARDALGDLEGAQRRRHREVTAGQRLAHTHHIGCHPGVFGGEQRARTPEARGDLVEHQEHTAFLGDLTQYPQVLGVVELHAPGSLHHRLHHDGGQFVGVLPYRAHQGVRIGRIDRGVESGRWSRNEHLFRQDTTPQRVHPAFGVAHAHGVEGVTVVSATPGEHPAFPPTTHG